MSDSTTTSGQRAIRITLATDDHTGAFPIRHVGPYDTTEQAQAVIVFFETRHGRTVPAGTQFEVVPHQPDYRHRAPRPPLDPDELALLIPDQGAGFPDVLDMLIVAHGTERAVAAYTKARGILDGWVQSTAREEQWAKRMEPVHAAADIARAMAAEEEQDGAAGSSAHRMFAATAGLMDRTIVDRDDLAVPMLAHIISLAQAICDSAAEIAEDTDDDQEAAA